MQNAESICVIFCCYLKSPMDCDIMIAITITFGGFCFMMRKWCRCAFLILCCMFALAVVSFAQIQQTYTVPDTDITISLPLPQWLAFTRDEVRGDEKLAEYGLTPEAMEAANLYLYALTYYDDNDSMELEVYVHTSDENGNLAYFRDTEVQKITEEYAHMVGAEEYDIYRNDYVFMRFEKPASESDTDGTKSRKLFFTIINGNLYSLIFHSTGFNEQKTADIYAALDSIVFRVDPSSYTAFCIDEFISEWMFNLILIAVITVFAYIVTAWENKRSQKNRLLYDEIVRSIAAQSLTDNNEEEPGYDDSEVSDAVSDDSNEMALSCDDGDVIHADDEYEDFDMDLLYPSDNPFTTLQNAALFLFGIQIAQVIVRMSNENGLQLIGPAGTLCNVITVSGFFLPTIAGIVFLVIYCIKHYAKWQF